LQSSRPPRFRGMLKGFRQEGRALKALRGSLLPFSTLPASSRVAGVASMWNAKEHHAWRTSKSVAENQKSHVQQQPRSLRIILPQPFTLLPPLGSVGLGIKGTEYDASAQILRTPYMDVRNIPYFSAYEEVLRTLVGQGRSWKKGTNIGHTIRWANTRRPNSWPTANKREPIQNPNVRGLID